MFLIFLPKLQTPSTEITKKLYLMTKLRDKMTKCDVSYSEVP